MMRSALRLAVVSAFFALSFVGCGDQDAPSAPPADSADQITHQLLNSDMQDIQNYSSSGAVALDQETSGLFTEVYGGTTGADLLNYLRARVRHYFTQNEFSSATYSPSNLAYLNWVTQSTIYSNAPRDQNVETVAQNEGILFWLIGVVNSTTLSLDIAGQTVTMDSPQNGLIVLGTAYSTDLPDFYRQSVLLHEARHSDCTGGISQAQIAAIQNEPNTEAFSSDQDAKTCGHLHVVCPTGQYAGYAACDNERFGAYGVQEVFTHANQIAVQSSGDEDQIAQADMIEIDTYSRLIGDLDGKPDMSSIDQPLPNP